MEKSSVSGLLQPLNGLEPKILMLSASEKPCALSDVSSENLNSLSTLKPDITLGLAHTSFTPFQRTILMLLQDDCRILSKPHQAQIGLRFPLLLRVKAARQAGT